MRQLDVGPIEVQGRQAGWWQGVVHVRWRVARSSLQRGDQSDPVRVLWPRP